MDAMQVGLDDGRWMARGLMVALAVGALAGCPEKDDDGGDGTDTSDTEDTEETDAVETDTESTDPPDETDVETDTDVPDPCLDSPAVITVGTGEDDFIALTAGQDLEMVHGPQGGWHQTTAVRIENTTQFVRLRVTLTDVASGAVVSDYPFNVALTPDPLGAWTCSGTHVNMLSILDFSAVDPDTGGPGDSGDTDAQGDEWLALCGKDLDIAITAELPDGEPLGSATVRVKSQPDPSDGPHCD